MSLPLTDDLGVVQTVTNGTPVYWNNGLGYDVNGLLCITTEVLPSDVFIGGKRRSVHGALVVADASEAGKPYFYNAGWPSDKNTGATIRQTGTPASTDPRVAGIAIGPLGGVYMTSAGFSPLDLFALGQPGFWYDPSDLATMFQDSAGTTPMAPVGTVADQPVGRILDKSGNDNHAFQATSTARPLLSARVNLFLATSTLSTQSVTTIAGQHRLYFTGAGTVTLSGTATGTYSAGTHIIACTAGSLTATVSGSVLTADIRLASQVGTGPVYQRVTTASDYDTEGFPLYLKFDGVDDCLQTAAFSMAPGKVTVFAGTANAKTASTGTLLEFSPNYMNNVGGFAMLTPSLAISHISFGSNGGAAGEKETQDAPVGNLRPRVLTCANDFATVGDYGCDYIRFNQIPIGNLIGAGNTEVGAGPYGTFPANIGARNNGAGGNFLWGNVYSLICAGDIYDEATLVKVEGWIDEKITGSGAPPTSIILTEDDGTTILYEDDGVTALTED